jgi:hypothetical protein
VARRPFRSDEPWSGVLLIPGLTCDVCRERATGIEPAFSAWEADVLPLNYARERSPHYPLARL